MLRAVPLGLDLLLALSLATCLPQAMTPTPTPAPADMVTPLVITMTDSGFEPHVFEIVANRKYKFVIDNRGTKTRSFLATRWVINVTTEPGTKAESAVFSDTEVGASASCGQRGRGFRPEWHCVVYIVADPTSAPGTTSSGAATPAPSPPPKVSRQAAEPLRW